MHNALMEALKFVADDAKESGSPMKVTAIVFDEHGSLALQYGYEAADGTESSTPFYAQPVRE